MVLRRELDARPEYSTMELYEMHEHARIQDGATQHVHDDKTDRDYDREVSVLRHTLTVSLCMAGLIMTFDLTFDLGPLTLP